MTEINMKQHQQLLKSCLTVLLLCCFQMNIFSQSACPNTNFSLGNFTHWTGYTGFYWQCCPTQGFFPSRHTIISQPGTDPKTGNQLQMIPPGKSHSARLGDSLVSNALAYGWAERLVYNLTVTEENALFLYKYAVVLEDAGHATHQQPKFTIRLLNAAGDLIDPVCGYYEVVASGQIPGFNDYGDIRWKDWTSVAIDLSDYLGQEVKIEYTTYDCSLGEHFGYAYISAECMPMEIKVQFCEYSTHVVLTAPEGYLSYTWMPVQITSRIISIPVPEPGMDFTCIMESHVPGCPVVLHASIDRVEISPDFSFQAGNQCNMIFTDQSLIENDVITSWLWDFGDGKTSVLKNPVHHYLLTNDYTVTLTVTSKNGCMESITKTVSYYLPGAEFNFTSNCMGDTLHFTDNSIMQAPETIVSWNWDFGDGHQASGQVVTHVYNSPGWFPVRLVIENSQGCHDTIIKNVRVYDFPVADFTQQSVCIGKKMQFTNQSAIASGDVLSYRWIMGDGIEYTDSLNVTHQYMLPGDYEVTLVSTSMYGCADTVTKPVRVHPLPLVDFAADSVRGCIPFVVRFTNMSDAGDVVWDFGNDTAPSSAANPTTIYQIPGKYDVSLLVTSPFGCINSTTKSAFIEALPLPVAVFTPSTALAYGNNPVVMFNDQSENAVRWIWNYGDKFSDNNEFHAQSPSVHTYTAPGKHTVTLTAFNEQGCSDTATGFVYILPSPGTILPNAFSPNGDGLNDYFTPIVEKYDAADFAMVIYDRFGRQIFETKDIITGWDGKDLRTGSKAAPGAYAYIVYVTLYGLKERYTGSVVIIY